MLARGESVAPALVLSADAEAVLAGWLSGKNPQTVADYQRDLATFAGYLATLETPRTVAGFLTLDIGTAHAVAHRYRGALMESGASPATVNRKLSALRSVVTFAKMTGHTPWTLELKGVETQAYRDTRGPSVDGVRAMFAPLAKRRDAKAVRDYAIVRLLFDLALRRAEVVSLDLAHVEWATGRLSILGKKRKERELVTLPAPTRAALEAWVAIRGQDAGPLFRNFDRAKKGERLTGRSVARLVLEAGETAGLGVVRPHGLRHSAITHALDQTKGDVRAVQKYSRHRDLRVLTIYDDNRTDLAGEVGALVAGAV